MMTALMSTGDSPPKSMASWLTIKVNVLALQTSLDALHEMALDFWVCRAYSRLKTHYVSYSRNGMDENGDL